jgi:hypothetical protein
MHMVIHRLCGQPENAFYMMGLISPYQETSEFVLAEKACDG